MQAKQWVLGCAMIASLLPAAKAADPVEDWSGIYNAKGLDGWGGAGLNIVSGEQRVLLYFQGSFPFGQTVHPCDCLAEGTPDGPNRYQFTTPEGDTFEGTLTVEPDKLVLDVTKQDCCGLGFPGTPGFPRSSRGPLFECTVKSEKAVFHNIDMEPTDSYLVRGDRVEVSDIEPNNESVLARFRGKAKHTIGRLKREELDCPKGPVQ